MNRGQSRPPSRLTVPGLVTLLGAVQFAFTGQKHYIRPMPQQPLDLPMQVAQAFVKDMKAYFAEPNAIRRDEIASRQAWLLQQHGSSKNKLRTHEVVEMFYALRDHA